MSDELSREAEELLARMKAGQDAQRAEHAGALEALAEAVAALPGRWKYRMIVFGAAGILIENIRSLRKELTVK